MTTKEHFDEIRSNFEESVASQAQLIDNHDASADAALVSMSVVMLAGVVMRSMEVLALTIEADHPKP